MTKPSPLQRDMIAITHCSTRFGMRVEMFACCDGHSNQGTGSQLDASAVEISLNDGPR